MRTKQFKYIIVSNGDVEKAILFDPFIVHSFITVKKFKIISAGFCTIYFDERSVNGLIVQANGESISLKLKSREIDRDIIYKSLMAGPWDYGIQPGDLMHNELEDSIKKKVINETE